VLAHVYALPEPVEQGLAPEPEHTAGGRHPERALLILREAEHLLLPPRRPRTGPLDAAGSEEGEPVAGANPHHAAGIGQDAGHLTGWQAVAGGVDAKAASGQGGEALRRGEPRRAVGAIVDRGNRIRRQTLRGGVAREAPVEEPAHATLEARRPDRSVATLVHGIDATLGQAVGWRVGPGAEPAALGKE